MFSEAYLKHDYRMRSVGEERSYDDGGDDHAHYSCGPDDHDRDGYADYSHGLCGDDGHGYAS